MRIARSTLGGWRQILCPAVACVVVALGLSSAPAAAVQTSPPVPVAGKAVPTQAPKPAPPMPTPRDPSLQLDAASLAALAASKAGHPLAAAKLVTAPPAPAPSSCVSLKGSTMPADPVRSLGLGAATAGQVCAAPAQFRQPIASAVHPGATTAGATPAVVQNSPTTFLSPDWVQAQPPAHPAGRAVASSAYDPVRHDLVLFGGCENVSPCDVNDTWTFDGTTWTRQAPTTSPSARDAYNQMAYDPALGGVVLFGGATNSGIDLADTWLWTGSNWVQLFPPVSPPARDAGSLTYDATRSELVLFGGETSSSVYLNDTWVFTAAGWSQVLPATSPPPSLSAMVVFDPATSSDVLFDNSGHTWVFNGTTWTQVFPATSPPARLTYSAVYDPDLAAVVLFGGFSYTLGFLNDTWAWNGSTWLSAGAIAAPSGRGEMTMAYDSDHHDIVLFGGTSLGSPLVLGDTWTYNPAVPAVTVTADQPPTAPYQRGGAITYTGTVTNPDVTTMAGVTFTDTFPAALSPAGTSFSIVDQATGQPVACAAPVSCSSSANQAVVSGLSIPPGDTLSVMYRAVAVGADGGCGQFADHVVATDAFGSSPVASVSVAICGSGLGVEPWLSYVTRPLGPQSTAKVNVANGNLVVQATDTTAVQGHGHLAYTIGRSYNSSDSAVGPLGVGWTLGLSGIGQASGAGGLNLGTVGLSVPGLELPGQPVSVTLVEGDGAREVFSSKGTSLAVSVGSLAGTTLANLIPRLLQAASQTSICVDQAFQAPPGVHMTLYRYLQVSVTGSGACTQGAGLTGAVDLGFVAEATDGLRYEFAATGQLLDVLDRNGTELRYLYDTVPLAGVVLGHLDGIYEPQSCPAQPLSGPPPSGCRAISLAYSNGKVQITDPAGRSTSYLLDAANPPHLVEVDNPDGTKVNYSYGSCGGGPNQLCSASDPRGASSAFTYQNPPPSTFAAYSAPPIATVTDRRGTSTSFSYGTIPSGGYTFALEAGHLALYDLIDSSGRVGGFAEGTAAGVYSRTRFDFWDGGPLAGVTGTCRAPDAAVDNNDCETILYAYNSAETGGGSVTTPDQTTTFTYSDEGKTLDAHLAMAAGAGGPPAAGPALDTTYGYHVQYFEGNGQVNCLDHTPTGSGAVSQSATGCKARPDATTLYVIVDQTALLPPRGNQVGAGFAPYQTLYKPDDNPGGTASPNVFVAGASYCGGAPASDTGDLCEVDSPSPIGAGAPAAATKYAYDASGQKTGMTTPNGGSSSYAYYPDTAKDLSGLTQAGGWLKGVTDPTGHFVAYGYDRAGNIARTWDRNATAAASQPLSAYPGTVANPTSCAYTETLNQTGAAAGVAQPCSSATAASALANPWRYQRSSRDPLGDLTSYTVDNNGNRTAITPPRGNQPGNTVNYTAAQSFDNNDNRLTATQPVGSSDGTTAGKATWTYDAFNNPATMVDPNSNLTAWTYDPVNRPIATRWSWGPSNPPAACPAVGSDPVFASGTHVCAAATSYDGINNVLATQDANHQTTTFAYDAAARRITTIVPGNLNGAKATVGLRTDTVYDADGHPTDSCPPREFDPTQSASAAATLNPPACTTAGIYSTHTAYNPAGKTVTVTTYRSTGVAKAANQAIVWTYGYDADGNTITSVPPDGFGPGGVAQDLTYTGYDLLDRKTCQSAPRQTGSTTAANACTGVGSSELANMVLETTRWQYDPSGDVINQTLPPAADGTARVAAWSYDADHRLIDTVTGATKTGGGAFGPGDNATKAGAADPAGATNIRTRQSYDADGHVIATYGPRAFATSTTTPSALFMQSVTYDADGRPVSQATPRDDAAAEATLGPSPTQANQCPAGAAGYPATTGVCTTAVAYDADSNIAHLILPSATDPAATTAANRHYDFSWTDTNLLAAVNSPDPQTDGARITAVTYSYDGAGRQTQAVDANGNTATTSYTPNELVAEVDQQGYTVGTNPVAPKTVYGYDANANPTTVTDGMANPTKTVYTADNLVQDSIDNVGDDTRYSYDANGNPLAVYSPSAVAKDPTNPTGTPTTNTYTLDNLLAAVTAPVTTTGATPTYTVTNWRQTAYNYDPAGRKTAQETTTTNTATPLTAAVACGTNSTTQCFGYYPDDRPAAQQGRGGADTIVTSYDPAGNPTSIVDHGPAGYTSTLSSSYYLDNLPRSVDDTAQTTSYSYDAAGNIAARVQAGDGLLGVTHNTQYLYHDSGQAAAASSDLTSATSNPAAPGAWAFGYDHAGRLVSQVDPNGETAAVAYNPDNTLAGKTVSAVGATIAAWAYQYNNDQQITAQIVTERGSSTLSNCTPSQPTGPCAGPYSYTYDHANRLASFADAGGTRTVSYDHDSNRTNYGVAADTYTPQPGQPKTLQLAYNADDSIAQTVAGTATQAFTYNLTGDLGTDGCNTYTQDGFDRTTQVANPGHPGCGPASTVAYSYDGLDRQRSHTDSLLNLLPITTDISYDGLNTTVASENPIGVTNLLATNYAVSPAGHPLAVSAALTTGGAQELVTDGTRTVALTTTNTPPNSAPPVDCTARFDPYGTPQYAQPGDAQHVCNTGATPNDVFYNGARHDATSGTYQFGSRTYDPTKAAFLTPDTYRATPSQANLSIGVDPLTRDTYNYLNGDPVNQTDLDGHGFCFAGHNPNGSCRGATEARQAAAGVARQAVGAAVGAIIITAGGGPEDPIGDGAAVAASAAASDYIGGQIDPPADTPPPSNPNPPTSAGPVEPPTGAPVEPPQPAPVEPPTGGPTTDTPPAGSTSGQTAANGTQPGGSTGPQNPQGSSADTAAQADATARAQAAHAEMIHTEDVGVANTTAPNSATTAAETEPAADAARAFAHGTSPGSAADIVDNGLSESAARAGSQGGLYDTPGSFHTIEINPANPSDALEIAHGYGLLQADPASVVVSELPGSVFQQMLDQGLATVEKVPGLGEQTVFHPSSYDIFNNVSNRYFFTPGGE